jgi:hypothetical protein
MAYLFSKKFEKTSLSRDHFFLGCGLWVAVECNVYPVEESLPDLTKIIRLGVPLL